MRDGIYKIQIESHGLKGFIIGALSKGRLTGCDQSHHITGHIKRDGNRLGGALLMKRHSRPSDRQEIVDLDDFELRFSGICSDSFGQFDAKIVEKPGMPVTAAFKWVCDF